MNPNFEPNYPDGKRTTLFQEGLEFQDYVCQDLAKYHIILQNIASKRFQYDVGENLQGFEIKFDQRCTETNRLSIEIAEKSKADRFGFTPSGIYRNDNSWLYIQGNYELYFVFPKQFLIRLHKTGRYREAEIPTCRKFYLPISDAYKYCARYFDYRPLPDLPAHLSRVK